MLRKLPVELLREIIGYIHQPSHLKALCLVSKTVSSIATQFLYRDLVLDIPPEKDHREVMLNVVEVVSKCDALRYVQTLKVGPIKGRMVKLFDRLISQLQDNSLLNFEWDPEEPPPNSQLVYLWQHQWNIKSIDLIEGMHAFRRVRLREGLQFPQKYIHLSIDEWLYEEDDDVFEKLDLSCLTSLKVTDFWTERLPTCISASLTHITNLQLHDICFGKTDLELDHFTSLRSLGLYHCLGASSLLSNFRYPNLKDLRFELGWDILDGPEMEMKDQDFEAQFSLIRRFNGLQTLVIEVPDERHPASFLTDLTNSISLNHNDTLRCLTLLDACTPERADIYTHGTTESRNSVFVAVMACTNLVQLELPTEWETKEIDFKRILDRLLSLRVFSIRFSFPRDRIPGFYHEKKLPFGMTILEFVGIPIRLSAMNLIWSIREKSSNLRLLTFELRGYKPRQCFARGCWSHDTLIDNKLVKYHMPDYELMPPYAPVDTWREYCAARRYWHEEAIRRTDDESDSDFGLCKGDRDGLNSLTT